MDFYRGGNSLQPKPREVKIDPVTGFVLPRRGVSNYSRADNLERFGGAHRVANVLEELKSIQLGGDPCHYEIVPAYPMPMQEYVDALNHITLVPT